MTGSADVARLVLVAVFAAAGVAKLAYGSRFVEALTLGGLVSPRLVSPVRWLLPPAEIATAALLLLNPLPPLAGLVAGALLVIFSASAWSIVRGGGTLPCACFGGVGGGATLDRGTVARNALLGVYATWIALASRASPSEIADAFRPHSGRAAPLALEAVALLLAPFVLGRAIALWTAAPTLADEALLERMRHVAPESGR